MWDMIVPFVAFVIAMTGTPGPGNLTMLAIGQTTGFKSAVPFLIGSMFGFAALNTMTAGGLGELYQLWPGVSQVLKVLGTVYILYLAVKILRLHAAPPSQVRRFTFLEGLLIHPLSPKSWAMSVSAYSQFVDSVRDGLEVAVVFVGIFMVFQVSFHSLWCAVGAALYNLLQSGRIRYAVNGSMVVLMLGATLYAMLV